LPICFLRTAIIGPLDPTYVDNRNKQHSNKHAIKQRREGDWHEDTSPSAASVGLFADKFDATRLASATIQAMDQLGGAAADDIEGTAEQVMSGASDVATKLHELATVISHHSEIANARVAAGVYEKGARRF
jgi:hypothetical protein